MGTSTSEGLMRGFDIPLDALRAVHELKKVDIVVGIPSYNNVGTIRHVVQAVQTGLGKYFPQFKSVIINSDGGSTDGTREAALSTKIEDTHLLLLPTPLFPVHRLSFPYHGIPGKGSAFRMIFQLAEMLQAEACLVVDSDLRSITPEWIDSLARPILMADYEFVAPYYYRHKYDGTITNSIVYPLTRSLYGLDVRQPIGGDFAIAASLVSRYLSRKDWETDVARYGIDIWMSTIAMAEKFRVCQSFLGAKLHDTKDPGSDLSAMLHQVVGSVFTLMLEYESVWKQQTGSEPVDLFGFRFGVGLDPTPVDLGRMLKSFQSGCQNLGEIWALALRPDTYAAIQKKGECPGCRAKGFLMEDELWVQVVHDFSVAFKNHPLERGYLMRSLTPIYLAKVASFVMEMESLLSDECEEKIEKLCRCFERLKPDLISHWDGGNPSDIQRCSRQRSPGYEKTRGIQLGGMNDV